MPWFGEDIFRTLTGQKTRDEERKARQLAAQTADPAIASRISQYRQRYPWLTPGAALAPAQAGLDVNDPAVARIAELAAKRKAKKGQGWFSIGDTPVTAAFDLIARNLDEAADAVKSGVRWTATAGMAGGELVSAEVRNLSKNFWDKPQGSFIDQITHREAFRETTLGVAVERLQHSEGGAGIGQGYLPRGPALEEQARRARESAFIEYADTPLFSLPGAQSGEVQPHAITTGRLLAKNVFQPGSRPFNFLSGVIDAATSWYTDPTAALGKGISEARTARKTFTAEETGRTGVKLVDETVQTRAPRTGREAAGLPKTNEPFTELNEFLPGVSPDDIGLVKSVRSSIHPPTTQNWLTQSAPGRKFTQWVADNNSSYTIWKTLGGEKGKITPDLAARMADTRTTDDVLTVLGDELGVGLRTKPITSQFQPVGGYLGEVKNSIYSNRIFNTLPHSAVHLEDMDESANQLVRLLRNGQFPESKIAPHFDSLARALTPEDAKLVFQNAEADLYEHILTDLTGPISGRAINKARLNGIFAKDMEVLNMVVRRQIAAKTGVEEVTLNGSQTKLRSIYEDSEYIDTMYQLPDARAMRRITTQYGRLLNHPVLDVPIGVLDHLSGVWKGLTILRPALTLRVVGEEQVRMAGAGMDSVVNHPLSAISWATGRKGGADIFNSPFDAADELTHFAKSQAKTATWRDRVISEGKQVIPFTDPNFVRAWGDDLFKFNQDEIARRLAAGEDINSIKAWLKSDEAVEYRALNEVTTDAADGYVENVNNWIKGKTYGNQSLLDTIATGQFNGKSVFQVSDQGHRTLTPGFQNHLKSLVDKDISPDHTIGDIIDPRSSKQSRDIYNHVTDKLFNTLLTRPSNFLSRSPTFRQTYYKNIQEGFIHASPEAQKVAIDGAIAAGIDKSVIKSMRESAKRASGNLTPEEFDLWAKAHALQAEKQLLFDLTDRNQLLDALRLVFLFSEAWKEVLTTWARLTVANPAIIPRAELTIRGARGSGFFYTDPQTGEEMFNYPGSQFVTKNLFGIPTPMAARAGSLNMFSENPLLPGFGPIVQVPVGKLLPDTPTNDFIRSVVLPYGEPGSPLPSWAQKIKTAFSDPEKNIAYANTVMDVSRYLVSTGQYDLSTDAGKQALEDAARSKAKLLYIFRGIAQAGLPAAPSYQDVAQDKDGHTTLAFTLTDRYRQLLKEDDDNNTQLAVGRFIEEFGMPNLLYMQSASKGGEVFSRPGYDWVRANPEIVSRYPDIYGLLAPNDGGFDIKAYHALFENGTRKTLPLSEALSLANHRAAKMILRNAQSKLPDPSKRTKDQRLWLDDVKSRLVVKFPGFDPEYQGTDVPKKIETLKRAINDPLLARQPVTPAVRAYLEARDKVEAIAKSKKIIGWQTAKSMRAQRDWLRSVAGRIASQSPHFLTIYDDLFDHELTDDEGV